MIALNTAIAKQLVDFKKDVEAIKSGGIKKDEAIFQVLKKYITESKKIRFEGNNYGDEWIAEAEKRGLTNINHIPTAFDAYLSQKSLDLFESQRVMTRKEVEARTEVRLETYIKKVQIEARVLGDLAINHIVPVAIAYQTELASNVAALRDVFDENEFKELASQRKELIKEISSHTRVIKSKVHDMVEARKVVNKIENTRKRAAAYADDVLPFLDEIRYHIDKLELIVSDEIWPLPKYRELLFTR